MDRIKVTEDSTRTMALQCMHGIRTIQWTGRQPHSPIILWNHRSYSHRSGNEALWTVVFH